MITIYLAIDVQIQLHAPRIHELHWNWIGKGLSIALGLAVVRIMRLSCAEIGLVLPRQNNWKWFVAGITIPVVLSIAVNTYFRGHNPFGLETILYQASLPGIAEEFVYRGVLFGLLMRAYGSKEGASLGFTVITITTLPFGLSHGFPFGVITFTFTWVFFLFALCLGCWLAIVRCCTKSIMIGVIAHNLANVVGLWAGNIG